MEDLPDTAVRVRVSGRVQGVSFRAWTKGRAQALGLSGWVRNEIDGSVTALIAGTEAQVAEMLRALEAGPMHARVTDVRVDPADPADAPPGFRITG
jgi:acylphosphatase